MMIIKNQGEGNTWVIFLTGTNTLFIPSVGNLANLFNYCPWVSLLSTPDKDLNILHNPIRLIFMVCFDFMLVVEKTHGEIGHLYEIASVKSYDKRGQKLVRYKN